MHPFSQPQITNVATLMPGGVGAQSEVPHLGQARAQSKHKRRGLANQWWAGNSCNGPGHTLLKFRGGPQTMGHG